MDADSSLLEEKPAPQSIKDDTQKESKFYHIEQQGDFAIFDENDAGYYDYG